MVEERIRGFDGSTAQSVPASVWRMPVWTVLFGLAVSAWLFRRMRTNERLLRMASDEREDLSRLITDSAADLIEILDSQGKRLFLSRSHELHLGFSPEELLPQPAWSRIHPDDLAGLREAVSDSIRLGCVREPGYRIQHRDGSWRHHESTVRSMPASDAGPRRIVIVARDVTDRKASESKLRKTEERLQLAVTSANLGMWDWDLHSNAVYMSPHWKSQLGCTDDEIVSGFDAWESRLHPDDHDGALKTVRAYLDCPWPNFEHEFRLRHKDGSYRWILAKASVHLGGDGKPARMTGVHVDITERKRAEEQLRASQDQLRATFDQAAVGIALMAPEGRWLKVNNRFCAMVGYTQSELLERNMCDLAHPEDLQADTDFFRRLLSGELAQYTLEQRYIHKDGHFVWVAMSLSIVRGVTGTGSFFISVLEDISERKQAQAALVESEARAQRSHAEAEAFLSTISTVLIGVDMNGRVARWNFSAERAFKIPAGLVLGEDIRDIPIPWDWPRVLEGITDCLGRCTAVELHDVHHKKENGKDGWLDLIFTPSVSGESDGLNFVILGMDTTQRRLLEGQLVQAQKLESIGQLAAGIAHEINTPTQFIGDNLRFLKDGFADVRKALDQLPALMGFAERGPAPPVELAAIRSAIQSADLDFLRDEIPKAVDQSLDGTSRVANIVQAMKDFSHPDAGDRKPTNLNKAIAATVTVARNEWKYVADLVTDFASDLPLVPCLVGEFNQVILNLVVNAAHAITDSAQVKAGGKGRIILSTRRDGEWVEIRVGDSGTGIPEHARTKIFDPFFTTKPVGKGTGQGLFITHSVITEKHGGTIVFETEMGIGTTFIIRLPLQARINKEAA